MRLEREEDGKAHIVALSGGKDSSAMALLLQEREPRNYSFVCTPTGDEFDDMVCHWQNLAKMLGAPLLPISGGHSLSGLIRNYEALPNWRARWCTRQLKIEPFMDLLVQNAPAVSYVGLRADEPERQGGLYDDLPGVEMRFPLRDWEMTKADVWSYLEGRGIDVPRRTDCARCFFQTLGEWWILWRDHPEIYADAENQEEKLAFESGQVPTKANQLDLFAQSQCRVCRL
jgi:3'-phosphoadenosine 5'-phosphosulfate sulfotransferase (PAPS reductase)/FAD synthetase